MDDQDAGAQQPAENLISRPPTEADLAGLCRELNQRGAKYIVIGGLAIIAAGLPRMTADVDLLVAADLENEAKLYSALSTLPDNAVSELQPGELLQCGVISRDKIGLRMMSHRCKFQEQSRILTISYE